MNAKGYNPNYSFDEQQPNRLLYTTESQFKKEIKNFFQYQDRSIWYYGYERGGQKVNNLFGRKTPCGGRTRLSHDNILSFVSKIKALKTPAFEKRAVQKLQDISDYINFYADTSLSLQFRVQAGKMIQESFLETADLQNFYKYLNCLKTQ